MILIKHTHCLEGTYRILLRVFSKYLPFGMSLHHRLLTFNWKSGGHFFTAQLNWFWNMEISFGLCIEMLENTAGTIIRAWKNLSLEVEIALLVLTFYNMGSVQNNLLPEKQWGRFLHPLFQILNSAVVAWKQPGIICKEPVCLCSNKTLFMDTKYSCFDCFSNTYKCCKTHF